MRDRLGRIINFVRMHWQSVLVLGAFVLLAAALRMSDVRDAEAFQGTVEREAETGDTVNRRFRFHLEDSAGAGTVAEEIGEQEMDLEVSPLRPEREEAFALLETAVSEWEDLCLGENASALEVRKDLVLPDSACDGLVRITYESSDCEVLATDGTVHTDSLSAGGETVELSARFACGEYVRIERTALLILPPEEGSAEWVLRELNRETAQAEEESRGQRAFSLPETVGGYRVIWETGESSAWMLFLLLGGAAAFCLEWRGKQQEKDRRKKRADRLDFEYPQMVDQFAVLLESGMTIRKAWERILMGGCRGESGGGKGKKHSSAIYLEEMWITYREIHEGRGEREAYERFGSRIGLMPYKRFSAILTQNLSKGTREMKELLRKESEEALNMRKSRALLKGEEAGTKMLFPMLVMLMLILLILLLPALSSL